MKTLVSAGLLALAPVIALAEAPGLTVSDAFARSANPRSGAAFMTIANAGDRDCALVGVTADVVGRAELHTHREENGVMKMVPVDSMTIPAGGTHMLQRGGDHVMFLALEQPLTDGQQIGLTLDLGDCGTLPVTIPVDNQRAQAAPAGMQGGAGAHAGHAMPGN
ncbi:copper chaperone PCu(A)C [uncultured Paracoccus sp.]|uniref:copper chaperone PCu(A)C n=1 Tax=uncultured Paracoccus sp. TaxID=189685 RepID=UPI00261D3157|nr:copper chaperone PCu(A)C [uncultured Paracoccus sp.]